MDNYFILSSKDGDKWAKVAPNMTSVKLGTCIHIVGTYFIFGSFNHPFNHSRFIHSLSQLSSVPSCICTQTSTISVPILVCVLLAANNSVKFYQNKSHHQGIKKNCSCLLLIFTNVFVFWFPGDSLA
jgi:hypothetical protein